MFILRFFAGPIVERICRLGSLVGATCGATGLTMLGNAGTGLAVVIAASIYGIGKTFLWPTMLAVVAPAFPRGGAITIGAMGGIGMLSAGLFGGPGIGYNQDYYASQQLQRTGPGCASSAKSDSKNSFLFFPEIQGLDGTKIRSVRLPGEGRCPADATGDAGA
jgi:hypothetical protein